MTVLAEMYITLMPIILAGILNMAWVKTQYMKSLSIPIDNNKYFFDGKRIFGDNKTWKGFYGMIVLSILMTVLWGKFCEIVPYLTEHNYLYVNKENSLILNTLTGFVLGFAYVIFELPNSFIKRRVDIVPGKKAAGLKGIIFVILDQADSILGCVLVIALVYKMTLLFYFSYVAVGALTHILINVLLYTAKLRRNMF